MLLEFSLGRCTSPAEHVSYNKDRAVSQARLVRGLSLGRCTSPAEHVSACAKPQPLHCIGKARVWWHMLAHRYGACKLAGKQGSLLSYSDGM